MDTTAEIKMFGTTIEAMENSKPPFYDNLMYAMAIMSDAQAMIEFGDGETARQYINKAKYFVGLARAESLVR